MSQQVEALAVVPFPTQQAEAKCHTLLSHHPVIISCHSCLWHKKNWPSCIFLYYLTYHGCSSSDFWYHNVTKSGVASGCMYLSQAHAQLNIIVLQRCSVLPLSPYIPIVLGQAVNILGTTARESYSFLKPLRKEASQ